MKRAETYAELWAICPHCNEHMAVEWMEAHDENTWYCDSCEKEFVYQGEE